MNMIAISVVAFCAAVISASAQTNPPISTRTINLTAEQYHVIKETVLKDATATPSSGSSAIKIGERVPATVNLRTFPPDAWQNIAEGGMSAFKRMPSKSRLKTTTGNRRNDADFVHPADTLIYSPNTASSAASDPT